MGLALIAFLPVFIALKETLKRKNFNRTLTVFIVGFFFKLIIIISGLYFLIKQANYPLIDTLISCMLFIILLQIFEALYFLKIQSNQ